MKNLDIPSNGLLSSTEVRAIVVALGGHAEVASALGVPKGEVVGWCNRGCPPGPAAVALRFIHRAIPDAPLAPTVGECLLCGGGAHKEVVPQVLLCNSCLHNPGVIATQLGFQLQVFSVSGAVVRSTLPFERPLHVTFRRQRKQEDDFEVGDEEFDAAVRIDTDDYEALFDCYQVLRRRILTYYITQYVPLTINVDQVTVGHSFGHLPAHVPALAVALTWSLVHERSPYA